MAYDSFKKYMSPDFQASAQPQMQWMPWDDQQQQSDQFGQLGSILGQLKPQGGMAKGGMMPDVEGKAMGGMGGKAGGGSSSL